MRYSRIGMIVAALAVATVQAAVAAPAETQVTPKLKPFDNEAVRLLAGPFKTAQDLDRTYLMTLDPERLLKNFRVNAGMPTSAQSLAGWEAPDCPIRGHFVGHYMTAMALMYASTGDPAVKQRSNYMVAELAKVQAKLGGGYLSAFPAAIWDQVEAAQPTWAQYYTIHKILAGMIDQYTYCDNAQALDVAKGMAAYFKGRLDKISDYQMDKNLGVIEEGGISESLWNLYAITGDPAHQALARKFEKNAFLGPLALEHDNLSKIHGNTHIPLAIGAARHYELTSDERYHTIARYFWERVIGTRTYATGGTTLLEVWPEPNQLADQLGYRNQECCKTYNLLKLSRHLFTWSADPRYGDYYQRGLFNSIWGSQDPQQGLLMYYMPLATGFQKSVLSSHGHFYCCTGSGVESHAKFNDSIFFHDDQALYVNLPIAASVDWAEKGIKIDQTTQFPEAGVQTFKVTAAQPTALALRVLVPWWATQGVQAKLNGQALSVSAQPSSYLEVNRTWANGDTLELTMPMSLTTVPMPNDSELMAFMYGPLVLAGITEPDTTGRPFVIAPGKDFPENDQHPNYDYFLNDPALISQWMTPVASKPLRFTAKTAQGHTLEFMPFSRITGERYGVYWVVTGAGSAREQKLKDEAAKREAADAAVRARAARIVDEVKVGDAANEAAHALKLENSITGPWQNRFWRHAEGWWSWDVKVLPDVPMTLLCTYWGSDAGRTFQILVDGQLLATQQLTGSKPNDYLDVEYAIPPAMTQGKDKITVKFIGVNGSIAGGVFACYTLKPAVTAVGLGDSKVLAMWQEAKN